MLFYKSLIVTATNLTTIMCCFKSSKHISYYINNNHDWFCDPYFFVEYYMNILKILLNFTF